MKRKKVAHVDPVAWAKKVRRRKIIGGIVAGLLLIAAVLIIVFRNVIFPAIQYAAAETAHKLGDEQGAVDRFALLGTYKDAEERAQEIAFDAQEDPALAPMLCEAKPGDVIVLGHYEQDNISQNGKEPIRWLVLARKNGRLLLLAESILDVGPYNTEEEKVTWSDCTLRERLNGEFLTEAFDEHERFLIAKSKVESSSNPAVGTSGGPDTYDKIFLLGYSDLLWIAEEGNAELMEGLYAAPTAYAVARGAKTHSQYGTACWWMRTPGNKQTSVIFIDMNGSPLHNYLVTKPDYGIRPALWVFAGAQQPHHKSSSENN